MQRFWTLVACATLATTVAACTDAAEPVAAVDGAEADSLRIGRVHVVIEPNTIDDSEDGLEITARFAFVRGLDEDFVRARINMPILSQDLLRPSQCTTDDGLWGSTELEPSDDVRELVLVDAGELRVKLGDERVSVPLSLVPDLLPYMSGVEYLYYGEDSPSALGSTMTVEADGSTADELPSFAVDGKIPADIALSFDPAHNVLRQRALVLQWEGRASTPIALRIQPLGADGEPLGDDITCVVPDEGGARLDLPELRTLGLARNASTLRIVASRITTTTFDVGAFTGSELIVERRAAVRVPLLRR